MARSTGSTDVSAPPLDEDTARALVSGHLETLLNRRQEIVSLNSEDIAKLAQVARATRFNCGGNNCG